MHAADTLVRRPEPVRPPGRGGVEDQVRTTRVGLLMPLELSYDDWCRTGPKLFRIADSSAWCLGDWLLHGQRCYRNRYKRAVEEAGLDYQTLRNYAWVARRFGHTRRRAALSLQHHAEVASLTDEQQDHWLDQAERNHWSRNEMRRHIRGRAGADRSREHSFLPRVQVADGELTCWKRAAENANTDLEAWIVVTLNRAATAVSASRSDEEFPS